MLNLTAPPKKSRRLQAWQAYSQLYYEDRVKATADRRWETLLEEKELGLITDMPNRLTFHRQMIMEFFEKESEEVKEEVEKYRQSESVNENSLSEDEGDSDDDDDDPEIKAQRAKAKTYLK